MDRSVGSFSRSCASPLVECFLGCLQVDQGCDVRVAWRGRQDRHTVAPPLMQLRCRRHRIGPIGAPRTWSWQLLEPLLEPGLLPAIGGGRIPESYRVLALMTLPPRTTHHCVGPGAVRDAMDGTATSALRFRWQRRDTSIEACFGPVVERPLEHRVGSHNSPPFAIHRLPVRPSTLQGSQRTLPCRQVRCCGDDGGARSLRETRASISAVRSAEPRSPADPLRPGGGHRRCAGRHVQSGG